VVRSDDPVRSAAERVGAAITRVAAAGRPPRLAIPGGSALAAVRPARAMLGPAWAHVRLTWIDERCVELVDRDSNRGEAYRSGALLPDHAPADELPLYLDAELPATAVRRVESALETRFEGGLDVLLLGIGDDGHVASLFPGGPAFEDGRVAHLGTSPKPPADRITLTLPFLATAQAAILLATGESKRAALTRLIDGDTALAASYLPHLTIVTDLDLGELE
jgi:6-phosphogluconolactonase